MNDNITCARVPTVYPLHTTRARNRTGMRHTTILPDHPTRTRLFSASALLLPPFGSNPCTAVCRYIPFLVLWAGWAYHGHRHSCHSLLCVIHTWLLCIHGLLDLWLGKHMGMVRGYRGTEEGYGEGRVWMWGCGCVISIISMISHTSVMISHRSGGVTSDWSERCYRML